MSVSYVKFVKHAGKVVKTARSARPVLQGVSHHEGTLTVTDAHRLYQATDTYEGSDKLENPITGELIDGNYPDTSRLIPSIHDAAHSAIFDVASTLAALKLIESAGKIDKATNLALIEDTGDGIYLKTHAKALAQVQFHVQAGSDSGFRLAANVKYLVEAFAFLKDAGFDKVQFHFYDSNRPFLFVADNLTILILPVKEY